MGQGASDVARIGAEVEHGGEMAIDVQETVTQSSCKLVAEVINIAAGGLIGRGALALKVLGRTVEHLEHRSARGLHGIVSGSGEGMGPRPSEGGKREKWP